MTELEKLTAKVEALEARTRALEIEGQVLVRSLACAWRELQATALEAGKPTMMAEYSIKILARQTVDTEAQKKAEP